MIAESEVLNRMGISPKGQCCTFLALDDKKGLKLYRSERERDENHSKQLYVFEKTGLAPEPFEKIEVAGYYGFVTERVEPICPGFSAEDRRFLNSLHWNEVAPFYADFNDALEVFWDDIKETDKELQKQGIRIEDKHAGNWGILRNRVVPIDFDHGDIPKE